MVSGRTASSPLRRRAGGVAGRARPGPWWARVPGGQLAVGLLIALMWVLAAGLGGCLEADTLGGEEPDEVQVGDPPTWDNGIGELMQLKCGVCHVVPAGPVSPDGIPGDLDLNVQFGGGGVNGAADALSDVQAQVQQRTMPLVYATPLTSQERQAILDWDGS